MPLSAGLHIHFSRTSVFKNSVVNIGIKLYHILPSKIVNWEKYSTLTSSVVGLLLPCHTFQGGF